MATPQHYDPRMGDEGSNETEHKEARFAEDGHPHAQKRVRLQDERAEQKEEKPSLLARVLDVIPIDLQWIPSNWSYSKMKPVIRSAIMGWVSIVLLIIPRVEQAMGQVRWLFQTFNIVVYVLPSYLSTGCILSGCRCVYCFAWQSAVYPFSPYLTSCFLGPAQ